MFLAIAAATVNGPLAARHLYDEAQYADAIAAYDELLEHKDVSSAMRLEAQLYLGFSHLALRHEEAARRQFRAVLQAAPGYVLPPYTPPKFRAVFDDTRREVTARADMALKKAVSTPLATGSRLSFVFLVQGAGDAKPILRWRWAGHGAYGALVLDVQTPGEARGEIRAEGGRTSLEYFAQLEGPHGTTAAVGSEAQPLVLQILSGAELPLTQTAVVTTPVYQKWWFWTIIGAVAVGGAATGIYFAVRPTATTGTVDLQLQGAR